jgi:hypothetical protein
MIQINIYIKDERVSKAQYRLILHEIIDSIYYVAYNACGQHAAIQ